MIEAAPQRPAAPPERWTVQRYLAETDEYPRSELYRGELIEMPSPLAVHQRMVKTVARVLDDVVEPKQLGEVFIAPLDVIFDDENTAQPDVIFVSKENAGIVRGHIWGAPDLIVEILSPSSVRRDRYEKLGLYAQFGVREYWIIDQANRSVEILALGEGRYSLHSSGVEKGRVASRLLADFTLELAALWPADS